MRTSTAHLAPRAILNPVLAWPLRPRDSLPLRTLSLGRRLFVFPIYPIVVSDRLHLDIGDIVVGHFLLDGYDRLDQPVWAPDGGHGGGDTTARVNSDGEFEKYRPALDVTLVALEAKLKTFSRRVAGAQRVGADGMARDDYRDRDRSRDRDRPRDDRRDDRRRDDRGRRDSRGADNDRRNPRGVSRDHHRQARDRDRDRRADEDMNRDRRGADDRTGKPPSEGDASAPEKKAEVRLRPPRFVRTSFFGTSTTTLARSLTPHPSRRALTPTPTLPRSR